MATPLVRNAMQLAIRTLSDRFVFGQTIEAALARALGVRRLRDTAIHSTCWARRR